MPICVLRLRDPPPTVKKSVSHDYQDALATGPCLYSLGSPQLKHEYWVAPKFITNSPSTSGSCDRALVMIHILVSGAFFHVWKWHDLHRA